MLVRWIVLIIVSPCSVTLTKYVTMQNLFHDGGFSSTGVTNAVMDRFCE